MNHPGRSIFITRPPLELSSCHRAVKMASMSESNQPSQLDREDQAIRAARELVPMRAAYLNYLAKLREVKQLFSEARMSPLPSVASFLEEENSGYGLSARSPRVIVTPPPEPPRPPQAENDWIWVKLTDLTVQTLILSVMREANERLSSNDLCQRVAKYHQDVNPGSVLNVGTRLDGTMMDRNSDGWLLTDPAKVPLIVGDYAWGPGSVFQPPDVAEYRRHLLRHVLRAERGGMQLVEIYIRLKDSGFFPGVTKDNIKGDLEMLDSRGEVRATGKPTRTRWVLNNYDIGPL